MSKLTENYIAVNEGRIAKSEFLRQSRQSFPQYINQFTSYDDAISIFRNRGLLSEEVHYRCMGDKFPLEQVEKGIKVELAKIGLTPMCTPSMEEYTKAKEKAISNLLKDSLYYVKEEACCCDKCKRSQAEAESKKGKDYKQKKTEEEMKEAKPKFLKESVEDDDPTTRRTNREQRYSEKDKVMIQLTQAIMQRVNPETGKKYTQAEAREKAKKMAKGHKLSTSVSEARMSADAKNLRAAQASEDDKAAEALFSHFLANRKKKDPVKGWAEKRTPKEILASVRKKFPKYVPSKIFMNNWNLVWLDRARGDIADAVTTGGAAYRGVGGTVHESSERDNRLLKEAVKRTVLKILSEAATANLAKLSDENASIQGIPAVLNSLENIVTEIESFIIKEQAKIQGVFDSIGSIKNEDNIPIGYKFVQPILDSFKQDLQPVLDKISLDSLNLPTAPESIEQQGDQPKQIVYSPNVPQDQEPLAESKRRYTK